MEVAQPRYIGRDGQVLPNDAPADQVIQSLYEVRIKPGVLYQPHPAFALDEQGQHRCTCGSKLASRWARAGSSAGLRWRAAWRRYADGATCSALQIGSTP